MGGSAICGVGDAVGDSARGEVRVAIGGIKAAGQIALSQPHAIVEAELHGGGQTRVAMRGVDSAAFCEVFEAFLPR